MKKNLNSVYKFNTQIILGTLGLSATQSLIAQNNLNRKGQINWYNAQDIGVEEGLERHQRDILTVYQKGGEGVVRDPVWDLSRHSAGMCLRFETDSSNIYIRYKLHLESLSMFHMPATGVWCGFIWSRW